MRSRLSGNASSVSTSANLGAPFFWWDQKVSNYTALLSGRTWIGSDGDSIQPKPTFITFSFQSRMTEADADAFTGSRSRWHPFSRKDKADARAALKKWGAASGITFLEAKGDHGDIQFSWTPQKDTSGLGYFPATDGRQRHHVRQFLCRILRGDRRQHLSQHLRPRVASPAIQPGRNMCCFTRSAMPSA